MDVVDKAPAWVSRMRGLRVGVVGVWFSDRQSSGAEGTQKKI
jgi:hypothetical protein